MPAEHQHPALDAPTAAAPRCPACRYDLSGTPPTWTHACPLRGTCPECGAVFAWSDPFCAAVLAPPWLFEYTHRSGPRAWLACAARVLIPWRFFDESRGIARATPVVVRRVVRFTVMSLVLSHVLVAILTTVQSVDRLRPAFAFGTPPQRQEAAWRVVVPLVWPYGGFGWTAHWSYRPMLGTAWWFFMLWVVLIGPCVWAVSRGVRSSHGEGAAGAAPARLLRISAYATVVVPVAMACWSGAFTAYVLGLWPRGSALSSRMTGMVYSAWLPASLMGLWVLLYWLSGGAGHLGGGRARLRVLCGLVLACIVAACVVCVWPGNTLWPVIRAAAAGP
ncbi:MAG: hypothetical protein ACKVS8_01725 [Phycisphaerales bacterium]